MAFMDKLGQMAGKAAEIAGDTIDYGKTKGKILLEKGKVKDGKEDLGDYVYNTFKNGGELNQSRIDELMAEIDVHLAEIAKLEAEAAPDADHAPAGEAASAEKPADGAEGEKTE